MVTPLTELHRHLDVCTRPSTLFQIAQSEHWIPLSTSLEAFSQDVLLTAPMQDLHTVLEHFQWHQRAFCRPDYIERITFEAIEDCVHEGIQHVELRYSPAFIAATSALSWSDSLAAIRRGRARARQSYPQIRVELLAIASRDYGVDSAEQTVDFFLDHPQDFIGIDLAGSEAAYPNALFATPFRRVQQEHRHRYGTNANITVHAGEAAGADSVWSAIEDLGASRIGHGIRSVEDPELLKTLRDRQICLEVCPTSNWITQAVAELKQHPLRQLIEAGVPVSINTDDPGIFATQLPNEFRIAQEVCGLSIQQIEKCRETAFLNRFQKKS